MTQNRPLSQRAFTLAALGLILSLSACSSAPKSSAKPDPQSVPNPNAALPSDRHPAKLVSAPDEIRLRVHASGPSAAQKEAMDNLVIAFRASGAFQLVITFPDRPGIEQALAPVHAYLRERGVMAQELGFIRQPAAPIANAQDTPSQEDVMVIGYGRDRAILPDCQKYAALDQGRRFDNQISKGFGCAASGNLAAMLEQPSDLKRPRGLDAADQSRRDVVKDKYRKGEKSGSDKDKDSDAGIAKRGQ